MFIRTQKGNSCVVKGIMLQIAPEVVEEIVQHGRQVYPAECCGILVGTTGAEKRVVRAHPARNLHKEMSRDRYEIDPLDFWKADKTSRENSLPGVEVIGFYHSHPDHPPHPSPVDRELAWPGYTYLIFSLVSGNTGYFKAWVLEESGTDFEEERVLIQP